MIRTLNRLVVLAATFGAGALVPRVFGVEDRAAQVACLAFPFVMLYGGIAMARQLYRERQQARQS